MTRLRVTDLALARLAEHAATRAPGVVRLHPSPGQAARRAAHRIGDQLRGPTRADPAVDVERGRDGCTVTVRLAVAAGPPVLEVIGAVQREVSAELARMAAVESAVVVQVLDIVDG